MQYWHWLIVVSTAFVALERLRPWRPEQPVFRRGWLRDIAFLAVNGYVFVLVAGGVSGWLYGTTLGDSAVESWRPIAHWAPVLQIAAFFFVRDLTQWCTHILLHKVPFLWQFHKVHHSITTMDWAGNMHYHWFENAVYNVAQAVPVAALGADQTHAMWVWVIGTAWGHFNHANVALGIGPLGYLFNSPRMHLWHHDISTEGGTSKNYGIVLSLWDWIFGTAYWPRERSPERIGYPGMEELPGTFGGQMAWPLHKLRPASRRARER